MTVEILMGDTNNKINYIGENKKAVGYYSYKTNKRTNTIIIFTNNFKGRIIIEGSLKENPNEDDWFSIPLDSNDYIEFNNESKRIYYNINGSFVWLRAIMDRSYFVDNELSDYEISELGNIQKIILCY